MTPMQKNGYVQGVALSKGAPPEKKSQYAAYKSVKHMARSSAAKSMAGKGG